MISNFKLAFNLDAKLLESDLDRIEVSDWVAHFNQGYYEGEWTGVALRSTSGLASQLYPDPSGKGSFTDTPILERCPNIRAVLASFQCPLRSVRFLRLAAGSIIREHRDYDLGYEDGQVRIHIPITTNADVDFFLDAHRIEMKEGECWYLDLSLPHWVENRGSTDRIHLVIDCEVNEWLRQLLPTDHQTIEQRIVQPVGQESLSSPAELERFRQFVLQDPKLQRRLRDTSDQQTFVRLVLELGSERGYRFSAAYVEGAINAARRAWFQRWIQ